MSGSFVKLPTTSTVAMLLLRLILILTICETLSDSYTVVVPVQILQQRSMTIPTSIIRRLHAPSSDDYDDDHHHHHVPQQVNHPSVLLTENEMIIARQFKIVTCSASSCAAMRNKLGLEEYATFTLLYERLVEHQLLSVIPIEETSCLGSCAMAPCVAIEHEDYDGTVALSGMYPSEFRLRTFHNVIQEQDVQRIWEILLQSIQTMAATNETEDDDTIYDSDDNNMDLYDDNFDNHPNAV